MSFYSNFIFSIVEHAVKAASFSEFPTYKVGAALYSYKEDCIAIGWNKQKTHPKQKEYAIKEGEPNKQFLHAEIDCLIKRRFTKDPYSMIIVRLTKTGYGMARPCPICMRAIKEAGIKYIYYTDRRGELVHEYIV
jgi:deoxycytidylate deaminase